MALKIEQSVIDACIEYRKEGLTLKEIVEKYKDYGVTLKWLRNQLSKKDVEKPLTPSQIAVEKIYPMAVSDIGVKQHECFSVYREAFGVTWDSGERKEVLNITQEQKDYIKARVRDKAKAAGKTALFVPDWMDRNNPEECNKLMLDCAQALNEAIEEQVCRFLHYFPDAGKRYRGFSVRNEILSLAVQGYGYGSVEARCSRNKNVAETLMKRQDIPAPTEQQVKEFMCQLEKAADEHYAVRKAKSDEDLEKHKELQTWIKRESPVETKASLETWDEILESLGY